MRHSHCTRTEVTVCPSPGTLKSSAQAKEADQGLGVIREGVGSKGEVVIMAQGEAQLCPHGSHPPAEEPSKARGGSERAPETFRGMEQLCAGATTEAAPTCL